MFSDRAPTETLGTRKNYTRINFVLLVPHTLPFIVVGDLLMNFPIGQPSSFQQMHQIVVPRSRRNELAADELFRPGKSAFSMWERRTQR